MYSPAQQRCPLSTVPHQSQSTPDVPHSQCGRLAPRSDNEKRRPRRAFGSLYADRLPATARTSTQGGPPFFSAASPQLLFSARNLSSNGVAGGAAIFRIPTLFQNACPAGRHDSTLHVPHAARERSLKEPYSDDCPLYAAQCDAMTLQFGVQRRAANIEQGFCTVLAAYFAARLA